MKKKKNLKNVGKKGILLSLFLIISNIAFGANGIPFYENLEFGLTILKVIGGLVAISSFLVAIYFHRQGRSDSLVTCVWIILGGCVTANVDWVMEKFGYVQGVIF